MRILDTNVVIRYLMGDHANHSLRSIAYFDRLYNGKEQALMIDGVVVEIVQVLSSKTQYRAPRQTIAEHLRTIMLLDGLTVQNRDAHVSALERYAVSSLVYVDCLNIAVMQKLGITEIVSFDRDFDRIDGITRVEP